MKKMILQMTAAQLLMQVVLTLYHLFGHQIGHEHSPELTSGVMCLIAGIPPVLFCHLEPGLRVQNHCRKRWQHIAVCLLLWGLECAAFTGLAFALIRSGLFPPHDVSETDLYCMIPLVSFLATVVLVLICFPSERYKEKRIARLYGRHDDSGD